MTVAVGENLSVNDCVEGYWACSCRVIGLVVGVGVVGGLRVCLCCCSRCCCSCCSCCSRCSTLEYLGENEARRSTSWEEKAKFVEVGDNELTRNLIDRKEDDIENNK